MLARDFIPMAQEKLSRLMDLELWEKSFTEPMVADLCLPQHAALYSDMCDRMYNHMGPALEKMTAQALIAHGRDPRQAQQLVGVGLYGILMTARRGKMTMNEAKEMVARLISHPRSAV